jgi:L-amino acid N-acyltransferase YncA
MTGAHAAAVLAIYQAGIDEGNATFETQAPAWEEFRAQARRPSGGSVYSDGHHRCSVETPLATACCRSWTSATIHDW